MGDISVNGDSSFILAVKKIPIFIFVDFPGGNTSTMGDLKQPFDVTEPAGILKPVWVKLRLPTEIIHFILIDVVSIASQKVVRVKTIAHSECI